MIDEKLTPIYHEVGHYLVAKALGYEGFITGDIKENNNYSFVPTTRFEESSKSYKHQLAIAFGGIAAQELLNLPLDAGYVGDLTIACEHLKKLRSLEGKNFSYNSYLDFPDNEHDFYLNTSKSIINQVGGKNAVLELSDYVFNELKKM